MALYLCTDCLEAADREPASVSRRAGLPFSGVPYPARRVDPLRALFGSLLGGVIGVLAGNPVAVLVGATAGALAAGLRSQDADPEKHASDTAWDTCIRCGSSGDIEICGGCGRPVCASHRQLIMGQEEHAGRTLYRHYIPEEKPDEDASFSLYQTLISGQSGPESPKTSYRLGDEVYEINEETGELVPLTEEGQTAEAAEAAGTDGGGSSQDLHGWGDPSIWDPADWESGSWESEDTSEEGGGG